MPIRNNHLIVVDLETTGLDTSKCYPVEIAAKVYNGRSLEPIPKAVFSEYCKPPKDHKIDDAIWQITGIKPEAIEKAPSVKLIYTKFIDFVNKYNVEGNKWTAPIVCGFNINRYDCLIMNRMLEDYGKKGSNTLCFSPMRTIDLYEQLFYWFSNTNDLQGYGLNDLRRYMGISTEGAHRALKDVEDTGTILMRFLKFYRELSKIYLPKFENCFAAKQVANDQ